MEIEIHIYFVKHDCSLITYFRIYLTCTAKTIKMPRLNPSICTPRALFIDLSGTIHIEDKVVPQSIEAINALKQSNVPHLFVTNTSKVCKGYQKVLF